MPTQTKEKKFWHISVEETAKVMSTDMQSGLSVREAEKRLAKFGRNTFEQGSHSGSLKIFLNQLKSPLIAVLIVAGIITIVIDHYGDAVFIFIAVVVNSVLGFWQENKAEQALAKLKTYLRQRTRVIRGGKEKEIDAEEVVPGEVVRLAQGDRVSADARVMFVNDFQVDESVLTGESLPVTKSPEPVGATAGVADQSSMVFAGTLVTQGVATAIVCRTDASTELGKIATLIAKSEHEKTPLQKAITKFSIYLSLLLCGLTLAVFIIGIISGQPILEMFLTSVAVAVSAIPEGLPVSMTVILAIGVERMAKRKGVVRKLIAAEALGSTTVILTDKTGTLTKASMVLSKILPYENLTAGPKDINETGILVRALTNAEVLIENPEEVPTKWRMDGRIMEMALVRSAAEKGLSYSEITDKSHVVQSLPFNPVQKYSAALVRENARNDSQEQSLAVVILGAPDILLSFSSLEENDKQVVRNRIDELASSGERILGLASKIVENGDNFSFSKDFDPSGLKLEALITFRDPIRPGIKHAVKRVSQAGIKTVIMTGDHKGTALAVAKEIGLKVRKHSTLDALEIASMSDEDIKKRLPELTVISRVTPSDKLRIAKLYQEEGEIVAMTGDGVNDAPSIKQADVGIAMGSGTEVAQSVADLVLLDDNFETIVAAIEEGRQILGNIRKVLVYLLSNVADGLILIGGSILAGVPLPLNALQILWVNFFSDSFPAVAFAFEKDKDGLKHRPYGKRLELFSPFMKFLILVIGVSTSALLFVLYFFLLKSGYDPDVVRTFIFAAFGTYTLLVALSVRSLDKSIFSLPLFSNPYLTGGILVGILLMAAAVYLPIFHRLFGTVPLSLDWVIAALLVGVFNIIVIEVAKKFFPKRN